MVNINPKCGFLSLDKQGRGRGGGGGGWVSIGSTGDPIMTGL